MKLATKFIVILVLAIITILTIDGYITLKRSTELFEADMRRDGLLLGRAMKDLIADVRVKRGQKRALELIADANRGEKLLNIRWVWLDVPQNDPYGPKVPQKEIEAVKRGQEVSFKASDESGRGYFYTYIPATTHEERPGALEISESLEPLNSYTHHAITRIFILIGVLLILSGFAVMLLGFVMIGRPLHLLTEKVRRVGTGDLSGPVRVREGNELSELAAALNKMCEQLGEAMEKLRSETAARIEAMEQLRHADRLRIIGSLSSGIAHELGTPLNVVSGRAGLITTGKLSGAEVLECANIIKSQSERMTKIIRQLLDYARRRPLQKTVVDLRQIVHQTFGFLAPLNQKHVELKLIDGDVPAILKADEGQIQQMLINLIVNAIQAMPQGGTVEVGFDHDQVKPTTGYMALKGKYICIHVRDTGQGISEDDLQHIFEPFFTRKNVGLGTGLGLSIAYNIIQEHGGWIDVKSQKGAGSCFSVYLPQELDE
jgi:signal transduction histidine kinase